MLWPAHSATWVVGTPALSQVDQKTRRASERGSCEQPPMGQMPKGPGYWMVPVGVDWSGFRLRAIIASSGTSKGARTPRSEAGVKPNRG